MLDFKNNVIYNWAGRAAGYNADGPNGTKMNFVGNYYRAGVNSTGSLAFSESTPSARAWFSGNCMNGSCPDDPWALVSFSNFTNLEEYLNNTKP